MSTRPAERRTTPDRTLPSWLGNLGDEFYALPLWVGRTGHCRAQCEADLPPHVVWTALLEFSGLPFGPRAIARILATFCGGSTKTKAHGFVRGSRLHCWPRASDIGRRAGLSERRVLDHLRALEAAGWVHVRRPSRRAPSDYWLTLPEVPRCPCGCEDEHPTCSVCDEVLDELDRSVDADVCCSCPADSRSVPSPDSSSPLSPDTSSGLNGVPSPPDRGAKGCPSPDDLAASPDDSSSESGRFGSRDLTNRPTHLVQALGTSLSSDHDRRSLREPASDEPADQAEHQEPEPPPPTKAERLEALPVEERLAELHHRLLGSGRLTEEQVRQQVEAHRAVWTEVA